MERSVSSLSSVLKRQTIPALIALSSVVSVSVLYLILTPPSYQVSGRLILDDKNVSISDLGRDLSRLSTGTLSVSPSATQSELIKSQRILQVALNKVLAQGYSASNPDLSVGAIKKKLKVKILPSTNILELGYENEDPELATKLLNAILESVVEENTESIRSEVKAAREFLEIEVPKKRLETEAAEAAENLYRQSSGIVSFDEQAKALVTSLANLKDQESTLLAQFKEVNARVQKLKQLTANTTPQGAYIAGRIGQDPDLQDVRKKLTEVEALLADQRSRFTNNSPAILSLLERRNNLRNLYQEKASQLLQKGQIVPSKNVSSDTISRDFTTQYISNEIDQIALSAKLAALRIKRDELQKSLTDLPIQQQPLIALIRKREEATDSLRLLQSKLAEVRIAEAQLVGNIQIIEPAQVPSVPSGPNKVGILIIAIAFGSVLAIGVVLLLEILDHRLHEASEVENLLDTPILKVLPHLPESMLELDYLGDFLSNAEFVEPYYQLLQSLEFRSDTKITSIVVSSSLAQEGKSSVVTHLAAVATLLRKRVLIIDANLRNPHQDHWFNLSSGPGLTEVIRGKVSLLDAAQATEIENLSVLTSGQTQERQVFLLKQEDVKLILEEAQPHYDLVIIDTPSLQKSADVCALSRCSDGLLMLIRPNCVTREALLRAVAELKENRVRLLGTVINQVETRLNPPKKLNYSKSLTNGKKGILLPPASHSIKLISTKLKLFWYLNKPLSSNSIHLAISQLFLSDRLPLYFDS